MAMNVRARRQYHRRRGKIWHVNIALLGKRENEAIHIKRRSEDNRRIYEPVCNAESINNFAPLFVIFGGISYREMSIKIKSEIARRRLH